MNQRLTDYDYLRAKMIGNLNWIIERYPHDKLLHEKLLYITNGMCSFTRLLLKDKDQLERFKKEIKGA